MLSFTFLGDPTSLHGASVRVVASNLTEARSMLAQHFEDVGLGGVEVELMEPEVCKAPVGSVEGIVGNV